jgi:hypothetical protein
MDSVQAVISQLVEGGGLNPRELRETTQALKQALDARRAEDPPETDEATKDEIEYVDTGLGDIKLPRTPQFADIIWKLEHGDPATYMERRFAAEKAEREAEREKEREQRES